jgi:hypothetical protein
MDLDINNDNSQSNYSELFYKDNNNFSSIPQSETKLNISNIFSGCEYNEGKDVLYGDTLNQTFLNNKTKPYLAKINSLNIPQIVKNKVEEKIILYNKRKHSFSDDELCSLILHSYQDLEIECNYENIMRMLGINPSKTRVMEHLSKTTTKSSISSNEEKTVSVLLMKPSNFIKEVYESYILRANIIISNSSIVSNKLLQISIEIENNFPLVLQNPPREISAAIIFLYLKRILPTLKRNVFNKKLFSSLPNIIPKRFENSLLVIDDIFSVLDVKNPIIFAI